MKMIEISKKKVTLREAIVEGTLLLKESTINMIKRKKIPKGDCLEAAKLAGILAAKKTPEIIPLCHPIPIEYAELKFGFEKNKIKIRTIVRARAKTGVEMEAFTATAAAALTIYDMCKGLDRGITIRDIRLIKKTGGKSGTYWGHA